MEGRREERREEGMKREKKKRKKERRKIVSFCFSHSSVDRLKPLK